MSNKQSSESFFKQLSKVFTGAPTLRRKISASDTLIAVPDRTKSSGALLFQRSSSPTYATITGNAYNLSERLMRYQDFATMEYCLTGDTLIATPDGFKTLLELSKECEGKPEHTFIVYSYDHEQGKIVPALGKQARHTRTDHAYRVTFDSGKTLTGSANHRLMLRDGTYCKIEDLKPGMAMMPFYRKDLFEKQRKSAQGYRWIYTMSKEPTAWRGWEREHTLIAEWVSGRKIASNEVVHHVNFKKDDNRPENLAIMLESDHLRYHTNLINFNTWKNPEWVERFKLNHSRFMKENNPAQRRDITFGRVLEVAERVNFNSKKICEALDTDVNVIKRRLREAGFENFETFAKAYDVSWKNAGWNNVGRNNPRFDETVTFEDVASKFDRGMSLKQLAQACSTTTTKVFNRIKDAGFDKFSEFANSYQNHKVVSVEYVGVLPLYDLTVDGYKNFATDSVVSHNTPEIAAALDIYADETTPQDEKGRILHVYSENEKVKSILEDLFYNVLNFDFNGRPWARNIVKYGDFFLYLDVDPSYGVINAIPAPVNEIEREEGYDKENPFAVRFRWNSLGSRSLENWEIAHFRLLGNDLFLPYGASIIEPARRIWRQLILIEDAMLVYRVVRAPERRVFYVDVGNLPADEIPNYLEQQRKVLRSSQVIDPTTSRVDLRYNPMSIDEDYILPVRGQDTGTKIETLAGGQNTAAVEDVEYIQKKLVAALKVPRAYLGFEDMLSSKATLAQEDIRFSRTVNAIQKTIIAELNKIAVIHLYSHGFRNNDLLDFNLRLTSPSTIAEQQKLELWRTRFEIAGTPPEGLVSRNFVQKNILNLTDKEVNEINDQLLEDVRFAKTLEAGGEVEEVGGGGEEVDIFGGEEETGETEETPPEETEPEELEAGPEELADDFDVELLTSADDGSASGMRLAVSAGFPVKKPTRLKNVLYNRGRRRTHGASKTHMPDFAKMTGLGDKDETLRNPYDSKSLLSLESVQKLNQKEVMPPRLGVDMQHMLRQMETSSKWQQTKTFRSSGILAESVEDVQNQISPENDEIVDLDIIDDRSVGARWR